MRWLAALLACAIAAGALGAADPPAQQPEATFAPMDRMRSLEGSWTGHVVGDLPSMKAVPAWLEYETVSDGRAVLERLGFGPKTTKARRDAMVSMYHQETDQLMMTHYCSANTQPRMRTRTIPADMSIFQFHFVDSTNILNASMMNIRHVILRFPAKDRLIQEWQSHAKAPPVVLDVRRER